MNRLWSWGRGILEKHREPIAYLFFGGVTTLENIAAYVLLAWLGLSTALANGVAWAISVLTAYITNRIWVFKSRSRGMAAARELATFVACRVGTGLMDEGIMVLGVDRLGLWGPGVKVFSNVLVILLNYVFSKLFIFKGKNRR